MEQERLHCSLAPSGRGRRIIILLIIVIVITVIVIIIVVLPEGFLR